MERRPVIWTLNASIAVILEQQTPTPCKKKSASVLVRGEVANIWTFQEPDPHYNGCCTRDYWGNVGWLLQLNGMATDKKVSKTVIYQERKLNMRATIYDLQVSRKCSFRGRSGLQMSIENYNKSIEHQKSNQSSHSKQAVIFFWCSNKLLYNHTADKLAPPTPKEKKRKQCLRVPEVND